MKIMASISGYSGSPVTLAGLIDPGTGVLAIAKDIRYRETADAGFAFVTNIRGESYDCLFNEDHWADAIRAYKVGEGDETVTLSDSIARHKPRIETDGVGETGQKYRLHSDLTNGEVAVLAMVHFQRHQKAIATTGMAMEDWFDVITI